MLTRVIDFLKGQRDHDPVHQPDRGRPGRRADRGRHLVPDGHLAPPADASSRRANGTASSTSSRAAAWPTPTRCGNSSSPTGASSWSTSTSGQGTVYTGAARIDPGGGGPGRGRGRGSRPPSGGSASSPRSGWTWRPRSRPSGPGWPASRRNSGSLRPRTSRPPQGPRGEPPAPGRHAQGRRRDPEEDDHDGTKTSPNRARRRSLPSPRRRTAKAWELRLYVAGQTPRAVTAFENLKKICEEHLAGRLPDRGHRSAEEPASWPGATRSSPCPPWCASCPSR